MNRREFWNRVAQNWGNEKKVEIPDVAQSGDSPEEIDAWLKSLAGDDEMDDLLSDLAEDDDLADIFDMISDEGEEKDSEEVSLEDIWAKMGL